jgi:hypothetical protein
MATEPTWRPVEGSDGRRFRLGDTQATLVPRDKFDNLPAAITDVLFVEPPDPAAASTLLAQLGAGVRLALPEHTDFAGLVPDDTTVQGHRLYRAGIERGPKMGEEHDTLRGRADWFARRHGPG